MPEARDTFGVHRRRMFNAPLHLRVKWSPTGSTLLGVTRQESLNTSGYQCGAAVNSRPILLH
eukprot:6454195-Amphidinium_carterae.3